MRKLLLAIITCTTLCGTKLSAQTKFEVPQNYVLKAKEDYAKYENDIVQADKWLEETDMDKEVDKRKQTEKFALDWVIGCPTINIIISGQLGKIYGKNEEFLLLYMLGYSKYFIENKTTATKESATKAALLSLIKVYKKGIKIRKSKEMEKLIKYAEEDKLDEYITDKMK